MGVVTTNDDRDCAIRSATAFLEARFRQRALRLPRRIGIGGEAVDDPIDEGLRLPLAAMNVRP
jgi:hypothetical protein